MKKTYKIEVDCANCANLMEEAARKTAGVQAATVNFMTQKLIVEFAEGQDPAAVAAYLAEELSLGDAEEAIASMRALLSDPSQLAPEDYDALFQSVVGMQGDLNHRRQAHKPLPPA